MREVDAFSIPDGNIAENADLRMGLTGFDFSDVRKWIMHAQIEPDLARKLTGGNSVRITLQKAPGEDIRIRLLRDVNVRPRAKGYKVGWVLRLENYNGVAGARIYLKTDNHWALHPHKNQNYYDVIRFAGGAEGTPATAPLLTGTTGWLNVEATIDFARLRKANPTIPASGIRSMSVDLFYGGAPESATEGGDGRIWLGCFYVVPLR